MSLNVSNARRYCATRLASAEETKQLGADQIMHIALTEGTSSVIYELLRRSLETTKVGENTEFRCEVMLHSRAEFRDVLSAAYEAGRRDGATFVAVPGAIQ